MQKPIFKSRLLKFSWQVTKFKTESGRSSSRLNTWKQGIMTCKSLVSISPCVPLTMRYQSVAIVEGERQKISDTQCLGQFGSSGFRCTCYTCCGMERCLMTVYYSNSVVLMIFPLMDHVRQHQAFYRLCYSNSVTRNQSPVVPTWTTGALSESSTLRHNVSSLLAPSSTAVSAHSQNAPGLREL